MKRELIKIRAAAKRLGFAVVNEERSRLSSAEYLELQPQLSRKEDRAQTVLMRAGSYLMCRSPRPAGASLFNYSHIPTADLRAVTILDTLECQFRRPTYKIRVSDHEARPTYMLLRGEAAFEVGTHQDSDGDADACIAWLTRVREVR